MSEYEILHKLLIEVKKDRSTKASDTQIDEVLAAIKGKNENIDMLESRFEILESDVAI